MDKDVIIIGGGVVGCSIARFLSQYDLKLALLEKNEDVCTGTSKANSGIVHSGYDPEPGTNKAKFNIRGAELIRELASTLDIDFTQNGSLIICDDESRVGELEALYEKGVKNGVKEMRILSKEKVHELEPNLNDNVVAALYCPTGGIVCPFSLTIAMAENAYENGCEFYFNSEVVAIKSFDGGYEVTLKDGKKMTTRALVNAAGLYSDTLHNMVSSEKVQIVPGRGNYMLLDKEVGQYVKRTIFQLPTELGKGVLVTPTAHGNLILGPTSIKQEDKEDTSTYADDFALIKRDGIKSVKSLNLNKVITSFSGVRAHLDSGDFIIEENKEAPLFFEALGIDSPGLTSAPAIGEYLATLISEKLNLAPKANFKAERKGFVKVANLPIEERKALIKQNPKYGTIVCRCEEISEGEILDAINRPLGATTLDGIKRRVRAGMGRCQAGFCQPRTMELLAQELGITLEQVRKNEEGSEVLYEA